MKDSYAKVFSNKQKVMFVFAHPDDAEIYCGGTIARLVKDGKQVLLVKMTKGNKGSRQEDVSEDQLANTRETEDSQALEILGLNHSDNVNLDLGDGQVENSLSTIEKLAAQIRRFRPDLIVTHNPEKTLVRDLEGAYYVNHRDHRHTATTVVDAAYPYSRDKLFFPSQLEPGQEGHSVSEFLFVDSWGHPDSISIDITPFSEVRTKAIAAHKSQYSQQKAQDSTDYFAPKEGDKRFESFWYVLAD